MDFTVHSLGSGSSGNSILIKAGSSNILIDAGITALQIQKRLSKFEVCLNDIDALFLTHEHGDHTRSAYTLSKRFGIPVVANPATLTALSRVFAPPNSRILDTGKSMEVGDLSIESFPVSHDAADPVGYNIRNGCHKVSLVTDTGVVCPHILGQIEGADLAIIESNHDVERLMNGPYPAFLKRRILSELGHLSNEAAADLILAYASGDSRPKCVWLWHLSDTNNRPRLAERYVQGRLTEAGCGNVALNVALRDVAELTWRPGQTAVQMNLFGNG